MRRRGEEGGGGWGEQEAFKCDGGGIWRIAELFASFCHPQLYSHVATSRQLRSHPRTFYKLLGSTKLGVSPILKVFGIICRYKSNVVQRERKGCGGLVPSG